MAHPDDETLWAGGIVLMRPELNWVIVTLSRKSDPDRAPRFRRAVAELGGSGAMADLDDGPDQLPLAVGKVQDGILSVLPALRYDLVLTHGPLGEYTRHRRHEETSRAVCELWRSGRLRTDEMWLFAYDDGNGSRLPAASPDADVKIELPQPVWLAKHRIIERVYGFTPDSFEARTTPRVEGFRSFRSAEEIDRRPREGRRTDEGPRAV